MNIVQQRALEIRRLIFKTACWANGGHIPSSLSMSDFMAVLYFDGVLLYDAKRPNWEERDFFILSKGHACLSLYVTLAIAGYFNRKDLKKFCKIGSNLGGHPKMYETPGVEASTGSLGHGLLFATGIALANKIDGLSSKVYVVLGDGECEEGSIWEGFMAAVHHKLDNLVVVIDHNKFQAMDSLDSILSIHNLAERAKSFGFIVDEIDGHDHAAIKVALKTGEKDRPKLIVANTIKGKGISFMEGQPIWHYRMPNQDEMKIALHDLQMSEQELNEI